MGWRIVSRASWSSIFDYATLLPYGLDTTIPTPYYLISSLTTVIKQAVTSQTLVSYGVNVKIGLCLQGNTQPSALSSTILFDHSDLLYSPLSSLSHLPLTCFYFLSPLLSSPLSILCYFVCSFSPCPLPLSSCLTSWCQSASGCHETECLMIWEGRIGSYWHSCIVCIVKCVEIYWSPLYCYICLISLYLIYFIKGWKCGQKLIFFILFMI